MCVFSRLAVKCEMRPGSGCFQDLCERLIVELHSTNELPHMEIEIEISDATRKSRSLFASLCWMTAFMEIHVLSYIVDMKFLITENHEGFQREQNHHA
jgi:hypothetical protein